MMVAALTRKTKGVCPACGSADLVVLPQIANIQLFPGLHFGYGGGEATLPSVVAVCQDCGLTQFFNAQVLGLAQELGLPSELDVSPFGEGKING